MHRHNHRKNVLLQTVLASTLFFGSAAHAIVINSTTNTPQVTSGDGVVQVHPAGQIDAVGDSAITFDSVGGKAIIDAGNINVFSAVTGDTDPIVSVEADDGILRIGAASGITSTNLNVLALSVLNDNFQLFNEGQILGNATMDRVVDIIGDNVRFENARNAVIQNTSGDNSSIIVGSGKGFTLINDGKLIQNDPAAAAGKDVINQNGSFTIVNNASGLILQKGLGATVVASANGGTGSFTNNSGGIVAITDPANNSISVDLIGDVEFYNAGLIASSKNAALEGASGTADTWLNEGTIESISGNAVQFNLFTINNGFTNKGNIINQTGGGIALVTNLSHFQLHQADGSIRGNVFLADDAGPLGNETLRLTGGTIDGNVTSGVAQANLITISGGSITQTLQLFTGDVLNLSGTGSVNRIAHGLNATTNISGGDFDLISGVFSGDSVNFTGTTTINGKIDNAETIRVQNAGTILTLNGRIGIPDVTGIKSFLVNEDTTLIPNGYVGFIGNGFGMTNQGTTLVTLASSAKAPVFDMTFQNTWSNEGVVDIGPNSILTITRSPLDGYVNTPDSSLVVRAFGPMGGPVVNGNLEVESVFNGQIVDLQAGSFLVPQFTGFIPQDSMINVVTVNDGQNFNGYINDDSTLVQPASAVVSFDRDLVSIVVGGIIQGQHLQLTANRNSYSSLTSYPGTGVAGALDVLAQGAGPTENDLYTLLSQLDQLPTAAAVSDAIASLAPPFNYGLIEASHIGMDSMFEGITDRVWDVAWHHRDHGRRHHGLPKAHKKRKGSNQGDSAGLNGIWLRPIGAYVDQGERDNVAGYHAKAVGGAIGFDWGVTDCTTFGLALGYTSASVDDKSVTPKDEHVKAWSGTAYGSFDFRHGIFMDAMVSGAHNDYTVNRVISVNNLLTGAHASFDGSQWGVQGDLGMALPNMDMFFAPFVRLKYMNVSMDDYTETGAGNLSLKVHNDDAHEFLGGIGVRMAGDVESGGVEWVPELTAMLGYDFNNDGEVTLANFIGGSPAFTTNGVTPGRTVFDLGLAVNALYSAHSVITVKYNLELRDSFVGNSGYVQYFYNWG